MIGSYRTIAFATRTHQAAGLSIIRVTNTCIGTRTGSAYR